MIKALLYDLDGVLVEAKEWHYIALNKALKEISNTEITRQEHITEFNGIPSTKKLEKLVSMGRVKQEDFSKIWRRKQDLTIETIKELAEYDVTKEELHKFTIKKGFVSVCVTNSITETTELMLRCTGQIDYLKFYISNQMVSHPKPSSEPYIIAMVRLGLEPKNCIIVEDSRIGLESARPTGCHIWHVKDCSAVTKTNFKEFLKEL